MTALNVVIDSAVHIVTDGVAYLPPDDTVCNFCAKVMTLPHLNAAFATSGPAGLVHLLGDALYSQASDLEQLMSSEIPAAVASRLAASHVVRMVIAGYSPRSGPGAWYLDGGRFKRLHRGAYYSQPAVEGFTPSGDTDRGEFEWSMLDLIDRQRRIHCVGGAITLTTIKPDCITQRILHRYPDKIGDVIPPKARAEKIAQPDRIGSGGGGADGPAARPSEARGNGPAGP